MSEKKSVSTLDAEGFVKSVLGDEAGEIFSYGLQDMLCYVRSMALTELDTDPQSLLGRFHSIFEAILTEAVKEFLSTTYGEKYKIFVDGDSVFDKNMEPIRQIMSIRARKAEIEKEVMSTVTSELHRGRRLAWQVVSRIRNKGKNVKERNYEFSPPAEMMEVELIRLERKLPLVSADEWKRLMELYRLGVQSADA